MHANARVASPPPPPFPAAADCIRFFNKEHRRLSRCARGLILLCSDSGSLPAGDSTLGTASTGLISGLQPDCFWCSTASFYDNEVLSGFIAV